jgi:murein DD-endopeptidase MepM/ murein hydrolase activator NlpD
MGFEEGALARLRRYRAEAGRSLELVRGAEEAARGFAERLFGGLEYTAALGREAGFEAETAREGKVLTLRVSAGPGATAEAAFGLLEGAAAETDEDLMHEDLSRYVLDPSGYSGRIVGFSGGAGDEPCQVFAEKARGNIDDPDEIVNGFCLRILGRLIDLAAPTGGSGRRWTAGPYPLKHLLEGRGFPTETRWFR